jgi:hypothetical protein
MKNLLAVIELEDEHHVLVERFLQSLPEGTKRVRTVGALGGFDRNWDGVRKRDKRRMLILSGESFDGIDDEYFAKGERRALIEIPDRLFVRTRYAHITRFLGEEHDITPTREGPIAEMVRLYQELTKKDPRELLLKDLEHRHIRDMLTKKRRVIGGRKLKPTYVGIGIETPDEKYLLGMKMDGPYSGKLPN